MPVHLLSMSTNCLWDRAAANRTFKPRVQLRKRFELALGREQWWKCPGLMWPRQANRSSRIKVLQHIKYAVVSLFPTPWGFTKGKIIRKSFLHGRITSLVCLFRSTFLWLGYQGLIWLSKRFSSLRNVIVPSKCGFVCEVATSLASVACVVGWLQS